MEYTKQHAAPLALIQEESAEDLETHNVVFLFAPVFVGLHRPTQSDVDVVQEILSPFSADHPLTRQISPDRCVGSATKFIRRCYTVRRQVAHSNSGGLAVG